MLFSCLTLGWLINPPLDPEKVGKLVESPCLCHTNIPCWVKIQTFPVTFHTTNHHLIKLDPGDIVGERQPLKHRDRALDRGCWIKTKDGRVLALIESCWEVQSRLQIWK